MSSLFSAVSRCYLSNGATLPRILSTGPQKGGVGKSTLARLLARELAQKRHARDDPPIWTPSRPPITAWASDRAEAGIEPERPHSSRQTAEVARAAHSIVIPTGQTKDDLRPAVQLAHSLVDAGVPASRIAFALVKTTRPQHRRVPCREDLPVPQPDRLHPARRASASLHRPRCREGGDRNLISQLERQGGAAGPGDDRSPG